jgi:hypothetical protein
MFIKVGAAITGGDRYNLDGTVKDANKKGYWLGSDGTLKAEEAEIGGTVNAYDGSFRGKVKAGPLYASFEDSVATDHLVFYPKTGIDVVWRSVGMGASLYKASGSYGNKMGVQSLSFSVRSFLDGGAVYSLIIEYSDRNTDQLTEKLDSELRIDIYRDTGKTLRLIDLPVGSGSAIGDVFIYGDGYLKVKTS